MKVAIVILNYNGRGFLEKFLPKVIQFSKGSEIIVADNASTDSSIGYLEEHFRKIRLIKLKQNKGYAGGYNEALKEVDADWFILMNSDIEPMENWLTNLTQYLIAHPNVKAAQPYILQLANPNQFEYAGAAGGYIDFLGYPFCRGRIFDTCEEQKQQYPSSDELHWASGACLAVERETFWKVGGFDEYLFAHQEEIDLCCKIRKAGHQIAAVANSQVLHVGGGTLQAESPRKTYLNFRNNLILIYKNFQGNSRGSVILIRLILDGLAGIKFLSQMKILHTMAIIKAHFGFYAYVFLHSKKCIYKPTNSIQLYQKSIVWQYFVKKIKKFSDLA